MPRFDLNTLSRCGAKTRNGTPCQRLGNKRNGRCKLHGGHSTGAKTEEGKLISSQNALKTVPAAIISGMISPKYQIRAIHAITQLNELMSHFPIDWCRVCDIVSRERIPLEMFKYHYLKQDIDTFVLLQSALDGYYQHTASPHLAFHLYVPMAQPSKYPIGISKGQIEAFIKRLDRIEVY